MTSDPLESCLIRSLSVTGRPFLSHMTYGAGSPPTEHVSTTRSATVTAFLPGGVRISGGTENIIDNYVYNGLHVFTAWTLREQYSITE